MIESAIPESTPLDEVVDRVRIIGREQMFRVGVRVLSETVSAVEAGTSFSTIAELLVQRLHAAARQEMKSKIRRGPGWPQLRGGHGQDGRTGNDRILRPRPHARLRQ